LNKVLSIKELALCQWVYTQKYLDMADNFA
jgi:hypothetical protein